VQGEKKPDVRLNGKSPAEHLRYDD
jgi:hypothetical protein